jgi:site-specific recombinase XerD
VHFEASPFVFSRRGLENLSLASYFRLKLHRPLVVSLIAKGMKLNDLFNEFINYSVLERCLEPNTISWYKSGIKIFYKYLRHKVLPANLESLTTKNLRDLFVGRRLQGNSPRTIINLMQSIKAFCSFLVKRNYLSKNPFDGLEKPKLKRSLPIFLDEEEARELLKACVDMKRFYKSARIRNIAIVALFLFTGIRRKELLNLKLEDLNLERGYIKVSAKNKERLVPLNDTVKDFLGEYLKVRPKRVIDNVFVSTSKSDSPLTEQGLADVFRELKSKVKFRKKISPQILRHTFCTLMLRNGVNLRDIQLLAGHSDISTTARFYLGCDEKQLQQAVDRHPLNI